MVRSVWIGIGLLGLTGCGDTPRSGAPAAERRPADAGVPASAARPAEASAGAASATRAFLSESQNGRSAYALPAAAGWAVRVRAPLPWGVNPRAVLTGGGRVLIEGPARWVLLESNGRLVRVSPPGASRPVLDPAAKLFYFLTDRFGMIEAASLDNGARVWDFQPDLADGASRTDFRVRGRTLVALTERAGAASPVEAFDLGASAAANDGMLTSARKIASLAYPGAVVAAAVGERLALAAKGRLVITDWQLRLRDEYERPVEPVAVSMDEASRVYVLSGPAGARQLAVYSPRGEQQYRVDLGRDAARAPTPPLVAFDHRVFVLLGDRVVALSAAGEKQWIQPFSALAGAIVMADDRLLVTAGPQLLTVDPAGGRRVVAALDEPFVTPPVLTESGEVLAATARNFVTFTSKAR